MGILVKRSAFSLGFLVIWQILEGIITGLIRWKLFDKETTEAVMGFFPQQSMYNLIKEPITRLEAVQTVADQVGESNSLDYQVHLYEILIVLGWTAIFVYLSYALLKKRDL